MTGTEALQSVQFVTVRGRRLAVLNDDPRPSDSQALDIPDLGHELRRLRLDRRRVVYAITEEDHIVDVLAVRKRPPYGYGDLSTLFAEIG